MLSLRSCQTLLSAVVLAVLLSSCSDNSEPLGMEEAPSGSGPDSADGDAAGDPDNSDSGRGMDLGPTSGDGGSRSDSGSVTSNRDGGGDASQPSTSPQDGGTAQIDFAFPMNDTPPNEDPFYRPPTLSGRPGDLIRSRTSPLVGLFGRMSPVQHTLVA